MDIDLICLDGDDTLWHNERYFTRVKSAFLEIVEPFAGADAARTRLEEIAIRNIPLYGYGAKSVTLSMMEAALDLAGERLTAADMAAILAAGRELLAHPVELLPEVDATLAILSDHAPLVLVTKGDLLHQETKLAASGLSARFAAVDIVSDKTPDIFRRVFARHGVTPERALMAGDSLRSDILPALEAGAWAAYIPHALAWSHEQAETPVCHPRFRELGSLAELPGWIGLR